MYVQGIVEILFYLFSKAQFCTFSLMLFGHCVRSHGGIAISNLGSLVAKPLSKVALQVQSLPNNVSRSLRSPLKETNLITKIHSNY